MTESEDDPAASGETLTAMAGSGTDADPYVVTTAEELQAMADDLTAHYELGDDIDAGETAAWNDGQGFEPVGGTDTPFTGSVDGNGHRIAGLTVDRSDRNYLGLFGHSEGTVSHLELEIALRGASFAGGVVGKNHEGGEIRDVSATVDIAMDDSFVGGVVGYNKGHVADAETRGTVSADNKTGGLVGRIDEAAQFERFLD